MKILIDLTALADNFSGIERYAACLSREMIQNNNDEFILLFKEEIHSVFLDSTNAPNVQIVVIPRCRKIIFNQIRLPLEIYKHKADCYLFLAFPVPVLLFKRNMISTVHDICCWDCPETMNGLSNWYFKLSHMVAMKKCKAIITISEFSKRRIIDKLKYSQNKIWLIYCGVDNKFLTYRGDEEKLSLIKEKYGLPDRYLLSLSTLEPRKNLQLLVSAYEELVKEQKVDIPLVLAGRKGWKMDEFLSAIDKSVINKIQFTGFIDDEDLPTVYGYSTLFVFPSMYEGFGMPPLEALACGTNVLSSDSSSLPEVLGESVYYFNNNDKNDLKFKIVEAIEKGVPCESYKKQTKKYSWNTEAIKLFDSIKRTM